MALVLAFLLAVFSGEASAHSELTSSQPRNGDLVDQAPEVVRATFSEELDSDQSSLRVYDASDNAVDLGDGSLDLNDPDHKSMVVSLPALPAGTYTVRWRALSIEDGDSTEGAFAFTVNIGEAASPNNLGQDNAPNSILWIGIIIAAVIVGAAIILYTLRRRSKDPGH